MHPVRAGARRRDGNRHPTQGQQMTTERNIIIHQGQAFALSLDYAGTAGRGQRMHIRLADSTATVVQILTHNGDANARVLFDGAAALDITIGASVSAGWVVLADRVEWVYDIEDYDLADEDDCVIPYRGKVIVRGNRTRASDVTPSDQMPSGDGRYVRFDGVQGLTADQQLQARENIGAGTGGGGGSGDVVGPASATDDRIAAFDGVTGKLIKQGGVTATAVASHLGSTSNPHSVTAAQVGADATGTAAAAVVAHTGATDPHGDRVFATGAVGTHAALTTGVHGLGGASQLNVGTTAGTVAAGDDARLSDARTPIAHDQGSDTITSTLLDVTGTTHTAAAGDDGKIYRFTHASGCAVTIPDSLAAGWSVGWVQVGNAQSTFAGSGSMVVANRQGHTKTAGQYASGGLLVQATNSVYLLGDTGA